VILFSCRHGVAEERLTEWDGIQQHP
jgi:hypothetical protein